MLVESLGAPPLRGAGADRPPGDRATGAALQNRLEVKRGDLARPLIQINDLRDCKAHYRDKSVLQY